MVRSDKQKIVAIIPARGGSKSIPKKNIIVFCGGPLLAWTIRQARAAKLVDEVYVSTDDAQIAKVARQSGAKVIVRPKSISGDKATSESALAHAIEQIVLRGRVKPKYIVFLQATSPLRESSDIDNAVRTIEKKRADSLFSGAKIGDFYIWKDLNGKLQSINYNYKNRKTRQAYGEQYVENGSIYVFQPEVLFKHNNRFGKKIAVSEMEFWKSFEIDEPKDLEFCKILFKAKGLYKK